MINRMVKRKKTIRLTIAGIEPKASALRSAKQLRKSFSNVRIKKIFKDPRSDQYGIYVGMLKKKRRKK